MTRMKNLRGELGGTGGKIVVKTPLITRIEEDYTDKMVLIYQISGSPKR